ncbi:hypothetical protein N7G274_004837 [Stereocaulon virgatum]|uniref:Uncharacterized protein n=1 Tax=Stereocaulon virgatum TaxID=373712 RepID=A0ABR4ABA0_9LECA
MARIRSLTLPLSHAKECSLIPPFSVHHDDAVNLHSCRAFQAIRGLLRTRNNDGFCHHHQPTTAEHEEAWLLQRDITYALILPVLEIHRYATQLALSILGDRNIYDLELVFGGEARGAFAWLQCFVAEEKQWCLMRGCPACVVEHVLQAEPTIRIVLTACRLAESLRRASESPNTFPVYDFWLSSLRRALDEDAFWGPDLWKGLRLRASDLENGIHQMVRQCMELEETHIPEGQSGDSVRKSRNAHVRGPTVGGSARPARLGTYKSDGKRIIFVSEESCWMQKIVLGYWTTLLVDAANVGRSAYA